MLKKPLIINDDSKIQAAYSSSLGYLEAHPELYRRIATYLWAYHEVGDLIPQTLENFSSGHYFPYSESYYELENSYELALLGFYNYAYLALRSVLELGLLSVYFAVNDNEHITVKPWITSAARTPRRQEIFDMLSGLPEFRTFDNQFNFKKRIMSNFEIVDKFAHTRGYHYSSSALSTSNFNQFSEKSMQSYCNLLFSIVTDLIIVFLVKYPIGMQGLPISEKFGLNGPAGGFLEEHQVQTIMSIIVEEERKFLKAISDENSTVNITVKYFDGLPDISSSDFKEQILDYDKRMIKQNGLESWLKAEKEFAEGYEHEDMKLYSDRIKYLIKWAIENGYAISGRWGQC